MTRSLRRIEWAALGGSVGSTVLLTLLALGPFLVGAHYGLWLLGLAVGIVLGLSWASPRNMWCSSRLASADAVGRAASRGRYRPSPNLRILGHQAAAGEPGA